MVNRLHSTLVTSLHILTLLWCMLLFCSSIEGELSILYTEEETNTTTETVEIEAFSLRVSVQNEIATSEYIIDNQWVAVGTSVDHAIGYDYSLLYDGKPSYQFCLLENDNTLDGYSDGETKGRAELCRTYATQEDVAGLSDTELSQDITCKILYYHGKDILPQGSTTNHRFAIYVPSTITEEVHTIFAQWHGMPNRCVLQKPDGVITTVTKAEFVEIASTMSFDDWEGIDPVTKEPNGWYIEQGGYPPMAFGFNEGYFYIQTNSDRRWMSDKTDRTNVSVADYGTMESKNSLYKHSTIAYREPMENFPKDCWVEFEVQVAWTSYGGIAETIDKAGHLYVARDGEVLVDNDILVGKNDEEGYYFKFGIYRTGSSTEPVLYNLAGYEQW